MRALLCAALLIAATLAHAQEALKPVSIEIQPLGDRDDGVVSWVFVRFANPHAITRAGLFIEGSISEPGRVPRNFRFPVPRKNDKFIWDHSFFKDGKLTRYTRWSVLPDQRNEMSFAHVFGVGGAEIEARIILEADYGGAPQLVGKGTQTFTIARTNHPFVDDQGDHEPLISTPDAPGDEGATAVTMRILRRKGNSKMIPVGVDAPAAVKRVEFWVEDKKVLAQNAPPFATEVDPGDSVKPVTVRAIAYDGKGSYVDAEALILNQDSTRIAVRITRTIAKDGIAHFKLTVSPAGARVKSVSLYAGDRKLHEWDRPPYTLSVPFSGLENVESVRAVVIDEHGDQATDVAKLR